MDLPNNYVEGNAKPPTWNPPPPAKEEKNKVPHTPQSRGVLNFHNRTDNMDEPSAKRDLKYRKKQVRLTPKSGNLPSPPVEKQAPAQGTGGANDEAMAAAFGV